MSKKNYHVSYSSYKLEQLEGNLYSINIVYTVTDRYTNLRQNITIKNKVYFIGDFPNSSRLRTVYQLADIWYRKLRAKYKTEVNKESLL